MENPNSPTTVQAVDSPFLSLGAPGEIAKGWKDDSFSMYIMFTPTGGGIPVPIKKVDWSWGASGVLTNGGWRLLSSTSSVGTVADSTAHPTWSNNIAPPKFTTNLFWYP